MFPKALPPFVSIKKAANLQKVNLTSDHFQVQPLMFTPILALSPQILWQTNCDNLWEFCDTYS